VKENNQRRSQRRFSRSRSQTSSGDATDNRLRSSSRDSRFRTSRHTSTAEQVIPQQRQETSTAAARESRQPHPLPSEARQSQEHSTAESMSDLSRIGSATCVLGSDTELQAVYCDMAQSEVNPGSIHKVLAVKQVDFASTPPTPSVNKPKLSVVAMKPAVTRLAFPDVISASNSDEPDNSSQDDVDTHRDRIKSLFEMYTQTPDRGSTSQNARTWNKTALAQLFCKAPRQSVDSIWTQLFPAVVPDASTARQFIDEIDTMRVTYKETLKSVCQTVRRM
jgi:hypothetical protein